MARRYRANWSYRAGLVAFAEGDVVELDDDVATHITVNDSPGVLTPVDADAAPDPEPEAEAEPAPEAEPEHEPEAEPTPEPEPAPEPTQRRGGGRRGS